MGPTFPGMEPTRWYNREWVATLLTVVPPLIASGVALEKEKDASVIPWVVASIAFLLIASAARLAISLNKDRRLASQESPTDITGCIHVAYQIIKLNKKIDDPKSDQGKLRITVYNRVSEHELEQCVPYVGGKGGAPGRRLPIQTGVVGLAARTNAPVVSRRKAGDYEQYLKELVQDHGFTPMGAEQVSRNRWSWMAVPLTGADGVIAVVFLDSIDADFFDMDTQQLILGACAGLASYIEVRYTK